jgi:hypothetical protein
MVRRPESKCWSSKAWQQASRNGTRWPTGRGELMAKARVPARSPASRGLCDPLAWPRPTRQPICAYTLTCHSNHYYGETNDSGYWLRPGPPPSSSRPNTGCLSRTSGNRCRLWGQSMSLLLKHDFPTVYETSSAGLQMKADGERSSTLLKSHTATSYPSGPDLIPACSARRRGKKLARWTSLRWWCTTV